MNAWTEVWVPERLLSGARVIGLKVKPLPLLAILPEALARAVVPLPRAAAEVVPIFAGKEADAPTLVVSFAAGAADWLDNAISVSAGAAALLLPLLSTSMGPPLLKAGLAEEVMLWLGTGGSMAVAFASLLVVVSSASICLYELSAQECKCCRRVHTMPVQSCSDSLVLSH